MWKFGDNPAPDALSDIGDQLEQLSRELMRVRNEVTERGIAAMIESGAGRPLYREQDGDRDIFVFVSGRALAVWVETAKDDAGNGYEMKTIAEEIEPRGARGAIYNLV